MDLGIAGKRALVLSAGGGLGCAIAVALAKEGVEVCISDRDEGALKATADKVGGTGARVHSFVWDLGVQEQWVGGAKSVLSEVGGIDILVNNTGGPQPGPAFGHSTAIWHEAFNSMVLSVVGITDILLPGMRERGWGRIITSTSSGVISPIANLALSNATRISLVGWSKSLARDVARDGVTANIVVPGRIATARTKFLDSAKAKREGREAGTVQAESEASIPMGRYGTPAEYADAIAYLASERASYITGTTLRVDGGLIPTV
ncbi:SDR family oxidoreductase [Cupriavidus pauculus]|uniref:3-oxoacyl-ACP reductase n=1 Tax=Cupriavidus pauculus TaxID=82633 RepID=A0A2N5C3J8_9BURK|nr:SDR family oxidoreductase [Cupriavidus pauculus]PLP96777.1 3-oxoacyl-ACP reductase [Cupriavidus pauculus]